MSRTLSKALVAALVAVLLPGIAFAQGSPVSDAATHTNLGAPGSTACATDTGSCNLNALDQRLLQRITTLITNLGSPFQAGSSLTANQGTPNAGGAAAWTTVDTNSAAILSAVSSAIPAGTNVIGKVDIDQTTPGTTNGVQVNSTTGGGATPFHVLSAASNNATLVSTGAHTLYSLVIAGTNTAIGDVRIYDAASSPTCSSATGVVLNFPVITTSGFLGGIVVPIPPQGILLANGLAYCITGAVADNDNTNAPTGINVNGAYK
jgi:hypothetical protein